MSMWRRRQPEQHLGSRGTLHTEAQVIEKHPLHTTSRATSAGSGSPATTTGSHAISSKLQRLEPGGDSALKNSASSGGAECRALSIQAAAVRARCERTAVKRGRTAFAEKRELGSMMRLWSMGVGSCLASRWLCKLEVTGSIPVRSIAL